MRDNRTYIIRTIFRDEYRDIKFYRFLVRNKSLILSFFGLWFALGLVLALFSIFKPLVAWFFLFFATVVIGAVDHIIIGNSISRVLKILKKEYGIEITKTELLEVCKYVLPK